MKCFQRARGPILSALAALLIAGCKSDSCCDSKSMTEEPKAAASTTATTASTASTAPKAAAVAAAPAAPKAPPAPAEPPKPTIRIKAGAFSPMKDSNGNVWAPDQGFVEGETTDRAEDLAITNTKDPALYRSEHYSMKSFSQKLPNGKYIVKLYFAETFEGISGPGERVFSFNVEGKEFKDFDIWVKAGGGLKAYIETVETDITDGQLDITFTANVENPEINAIEILPAS